jgi:hypothetical protein
MPGLHLGESGLEFFDAAAIDLRDRPGSRSAPASSAATAHQVLNDKRFVAFVVCRAPWSFNLKAVRNGEAQGGKRSAAPIERIRPSSRARHVRAGGFAPPRTGAITQGPRWGGPTRRRRAGPSDLRLVIPFG